MSRLVSLVVLTFLALAPATHAATLQIDYVVDAKVLKKDAAAGTQLTFEIYGDAACNSLVASDTAAIESVALLEQPRLIRVKRGPTVPQAAKIHHQITSSEAPSQVYAKVTGAGISPLGGACQLQAASVGHVPRAVVKDTNGAVLGAFQSGLSFAGLTFGESDVVVIDLGSTVCPLFLYPNTPGGLFGRASANGSGVFYPGSGCTGGPLLSPAGQAFAPSCEIGVGQIAYARPSLPSSASTPVLSYATQGYTSGTCGGAFTAPDTCCFPFSGSVLVGPPSASRDLSVFTPPYTVELQ